MSTLKKFAEQSNSENYSWISTINSAFILIASLSGGGLGVITNVYIIYHLKIFGYCICLLLITIIAFVTFQFLYSAADISNLYSSHSISDRYFGGKNGSMIVRIFIVIGNWSVIINLMQLFADFLPGIIQSWLNNYDIFYTHRWFAVLIGSIIMFPWIIVKNISKLNTITITTFIIILFAHFVMFLNALKALYPGNISSDIDIITFNYYDISTGLSSSSKFYYDVQLNLFQYL